MSIGILTWPNEAGLDNYPLADSIGATNFILDASFIQFDAFVPIIKSVVVTQEDITVAVLFDEGEISTTITRSTFVVGAPYHFVGLGARNLGKIVVGDGANWLWDNLLNQTIVLDISFLPNVVVSVPSASGLFSINISSTERFTGAVHLVFKKYDTVTLAFIDDTTMTATDSGNEAYIDAVSLPEDGGYKALKTLNGVVPVDNNISIDSSETIKVSTSGASVVNLRLVTDDIYRDASIMSTLNSP